LPFALIPIYRFEIGIAFSESKLSMLDTGFSRPFSRVIGVFAYTRLQNVVDNQVERAQDRMPPLLWVVYNPTTLGNTRDKGLFWVVFKFWRSVAHERPTRNQNLRVLRRCVSSRERTTTFSFARL